ncbi:unnamed protein product [Sphagnum balticum]
MEHGFGKIGAPFVILLVLVLFYCCCCCCCCADTTTLVSADAAAELKAEREEEELELELEEKEDEEGVSSFHIVLGGGRRLLVGSDDGEGRGDLFAELNVLAKEIGNEILAVRKAEEGITEEETAGDGELNQRIMRFRFTEEENSAAPANDADQQKEGHNKSPQDNPKTNQTTETSQDAGTLPDGGEDDAAGATTKEENPASQERDCGGDPLLAKLKTAGEGNHDWTLTVTNTGKDELKVKVVAESLKANPAELSLKTGEEYKVAITVVDNGIKIADKINITWGAGYCQINVPENSFPSSQLQSSAYLNFIPVTRTGFILFGGTILFVAILGIAGIWGCVSRCARARWPGAGSVKYQELEMSIPTVDSSKKDTEDGPLSAEGWDEIWEDDEWEDTEAVRSSSSLQTLSSQGLNVRRANKDGRDSAWDD